MNHNYYEFDDDSYTVLAAAGVAWQDAVFVLRQSRPVVRRHTGAVLTIAGRDRQGRWIAVALIELGPAQNDQPARNDQPALNDQPDRNDQAAQNDHYTVAGARHLDATEVAAVVRMLKGQL